MNLVKSFQHAINGVAASVSTEINLKIEICFGLVVIGLGHFFNISNYEWLVLCLIISSVIAAELLNTAIESLTNIVSPQPHPLAKKAKDAAAGAVLVLSIGSIGIAWFLFGIKIQYLLFGP